LKFFSISGCLFTVSIDAESWPIYGELSNGQIHGCDLIVSATGVMPNCDWFPGDKLMDKGIIVDSQLRTSIPNVYAAGDVCFPAWDWAKHWFNVRSIKMYMLIAY